MLKRKLFVVMALVGAFFMAGAAMAQGAGDLGKSWPNAVDQSRAAGLHAYRFNHEGVAYVQVNSANGTPVLAVAAAGGAILVLPVGDPSRVTLGTAQQAASTSGTTVYADDAVTVQETAAGFLVAPAGGGTCTDPADCTRPQVQAVQTLSTMSAADCTNPADCTRVN